MNVANHFVPRALADPSSVIYKQVTSEANYCPAHVLGGCCPLQGEEPYTRRVKVQVGCVVDQRPHIWNEELLWLVLLYIAELELWEFLQVHNRGQVVHKC